MGLNPTASVFLKEGRFNLATYRDRGETLSQEPEDSSKQRPPSHICWRLRKEPSLHMPSPWTLTSGTEATDCCGATQSMVLPGKHESEAPEGTGSPGCPAPCWGELPSWQNTKALPGRSELSVELQEQLGQPGGT